MEQSPWEANRFSANQEIPRTLCIPKVYYRIHKARHLSALSQLEPVHALTSHFLKMHFKIILPFRRSIPKWSLSLRIPQKTLV